MYEIIVILKALTEIAGVAFLGQGVLWAIAGSKRDQNLVYKLFKTHRRAHRAGGLFPADGDLGGADGVQDQDRDGECAGCSMRHHSLSHLRQRTCEDEISLKRAYAPHAPQVACSPSHSASVRIFWYLTKP